MLTLEQFFRKHYQDLIQREIEDIIEILTAPKTANDKIKDHADYTFYTGVLYGLKESIRLMEEASVAAEKAAR